MKLLRNTWTRIMLLMMTVTVITCGAGFTQSAQAAGKAHYIAVSSDRHSTTDAIKIAMSNMPDSMEYVCLNGDMPNAVRRSSGSMPIIPPSGSIQPYVQSQEPYNTSTVLQEVQGVFPKLTNKNVSIIYASHDANATDDAGIMKCADPATLPTSTGADNASVSQGRSGLIYTGFDGDKPAYYIYGVSYYDTMNPGEDTDDSIPDADLPEGSKKSAKAFMAFADAHKDVPLVVIGHIPLHAIRGDNLGASYWNEALNYAATGSTNGTAVKREVVYLHGHNHTVESTEYCVRPGETLSIQGRSRGVSANSVIYYTYMTGGYLRDHHTATLVTVKDGHISLTKYKGIVVKYETNGGNEISNAIANRENKAPKPATPVRNGYVFTGWYKEPACENIWSFDKDNTADDITLYAGWVKGAKPNSTVLTTRLNPAKKKIRLTWKKSAGASDYRISYQQSGSGKWVRKWSNGSTGYTIKGLTLRGLYDFKVCAAAESGDRMIYSKDSKISRRYMNTMTGMKAKGGKKAISISWKKDKKAASYRIRYSTTKKMQKSVYITVRASKLSYKIRNLEAGKKYYIRVKPMVRKKGVTYSGAYSPLLSVKTK